MSNANRVSRGLAFTALLTLLATTTAVKAENPIQKARNGYLPQPPAAVKTTSVSEWTVDVDALKARYSYQPEAVGNGSAAGEVVYPDAIAQARDGYVYTPEVKQTVSGKQVARK